MANGIMGRLQALLRAFMPKEEDFFLLFERGSEAALKAARTLQVVVANFDRLDLAVEDIAQIEREGDTVVHDVLSRLHSTFVTPVLFDREDLYRIAERMDDVTDLVKGAIDRMKTFRVDEPTETIVRQAQLLSSAVDVLHDTMHNLEKLEPGRGDYCARINTFENEADILLKTALGELLNSGEDPTYILKWKEIYETVENAIDAAEDTANLVEAVIVKNA